MAGLGEFLELELQASPGELPQAAACIESLQAQRTYDEVIFLTPDGELLNQGMANELSLKNMAYAFGVRTHKSGDYKSKKSDDDEDDKPETKYDADSFFNLPDNDDDDDNDDD